MLHEKYVKYLFVVKMFCASLATFICMFGESALRFKIRGSVIFTTLLFRFEVFTVKKI
jgi:hypothetical protein